MSPRRQCPLVGCRIFPDDMLGHLADLHGLDEDEARERLRKQQIDDCLLELQLQAGRRCRDFTLDSFPAQDDAGRSALDAARAWLAWDDPRYQTATIFLYGPPGTGKTGLAYAIARDAIQVPPSSLVQFINVRSLLTELKLEIADGKTPNLDERIMADLLILDDLGAERPTDWAVEQIALIVEQRYVADEGATIVTTNYSPAQLATRLSTRNDPVAGQRIVSRLLEDATVIHLDRVDQRIAKGRAE